MAQITPNETTSASGRAAEFNQHLLRARERFDDSVDFTIGVEEEYAICDPATLDLTPRYDELRSAAIEAGLSEYVAGELLASEIEFRTMRCETWQDAVEELLDIRRRVSKVAREIDIVLATSATHPWADYRKQSIVELPYYMELVERMQYVAHRNNTFGLHVHVGVRGSDRAIRVADALRNYQPLLLALSASSPFLEDRDTGMASIRHMIFSRNFPRGNVAPIFGTLDDYTRYLSWLRDAGSIDSIGSVWWGTRPHLLHGTVELRMFDGQPDAQDTLALTALSVGVVAHLCELHDTGELFQPVDTHMLEENCWRAARYGTDAVFIDLPGVRQIHAREAIGTLIDLASKAARNASLDIQSGLDRAREMLEAGCSASWQRSMLEAGSGLSEAYGAVVAATMSSGDH